MGAEPFVEHVEYIYVKRYYHRYSIEDNILKTNVLFNQYHYHGYLILNRSHEHQNAQNA